MIPMARMHARWTVLLCLGATCVVTPARAASPEDPPVVKTTIEATLDPDRRTIEGVLHLGWKNASPVAVDRIPLHLYMNGFRTPQTVWMSQAEARHRSSNVGEDDPYGYCDVTKARQRGPSGEFAVVALAERQDPSLADVSLAWPVAPGATLELELTFVTRLPEVFARTGYRHDFYLAGQWFPKIAKHEPTGSFAAFEFHHYGEFYADFGSYDVSLTVPAEMIVGATGQIVESTSPDEERQRLRYRADRVHDFAWTAWPGFVAHEGEIGDLAVRVLLPRGHSGDLEVHMQALSSALESMETRFGPYPWPNLTVVQPPSFASGASGMEYPTFVTTDPSLELPGWIEGLGFEHRLGGALTTVHEFGHQYFQGMLASNEDAAPWLDEGLTTFASLLVLEDHAARHGPEGDSPWVVRVGRSELRGDDLLRLALRRRFRGSPSAQPAEAFDPATDSYGESAYYHPAALLMTLRRLVGAAAFDAALRHYVDRFRFDHPTTAQFEAALLDSLGERPTLGPQIGGPGSGTVTMDVGATLHQGLHTTANVAFSVRRVANLRTPTTGGFVRDDGRLVPDPRPPQEIWTGTAVIERKGDFVIPVEIEVEFKDGGIVSGYWDGQARHVVLRFPERPIARVSLDPRQQLVLESDRHDNHRYASRVTRPRGPERVLGLATEALAWATMTLVGP